MDDERSIGVPEDLLRKLESICDETERIEAALVSIETRRKLAVIRDAARHRFPAPDIERMIAETEEGYR